MLVRGAGAVDLEVRTSHCCRKYSHSSAGAPSEMRMSRGLSSAVKWQNPGSRNLEQERNWEPYIYIHLGGESPTELALQGE